MPASAGHPTDMLGIVQLDADDITRIAHLLQKCQTFLHVMAARGEARHDKALLVKLQQDQVRVRLIFEFLPGQHHDSASQVVG